MKVIARSVYNWKKGYSHPILSSIFEGFVLGSSMALIPTETTWFPRREIHRVEVYYDRCRSQYPNPSRISHPYNDKFRVQIVRNYINYYIAALAESEVAFIQNSLKIRSPNSSVGTNPSTSNSSELYSSAEPVCQNLSVWFVLATSTLWALLCGNWMQVGYKQKELIRLGFPMQ